MEDYPEITNIVVLNINLEVPLQSPGKYPCLKDIKPIKTKKNLKVKMYGVNNQTRI